VNTVWITRSEPGAGRLAAVLGEAGYATLTAPVIGIEPLASDPPAGAFEIGVVLSAHAASAVAKISARLPSVLAIGSATRTALAALGVTADAASDASSEGVLDAFVTRAPARVLIVGGEGGRGWLAPHLEAYGHTVAQWRVYRRRTLTPAIDAATIHAIVAGSGDGARQAARVWFAAGGATSGPCIVPSARAAADAREAGFERVHAASGASPRAALEALRALGT
jgi:uroporphyrinogen-III synthase